MGQNSENIDKYLGQSKIVINKGYKLIIEDYITGIVNANDNERRSSACKIINYLIKINVVFVIY